MQYLHYESLGVVPDAKPIAPILSTVGGEQGGRAPIVIEDKNIQQAVGVAPENVETMADPGKPEPGRDIFAGEPVKDIKSSNVPDQPPPAAAEPVREQKEISSVNVGSMSSSTSTSTTTSDGTAKEPAGSLVVSDTATAQPSDATTIESSSSSAPAADADAAKVQAAGPLGEAEHEARKVANELYPDAKN